MNLKPNTKKKNIIILVSLIIALLVINYPFLDKALQKFLTNYESVKVERVIDGDTIKSQNQSIRLLGINSPEKGELYYTEAKEFLENEILNKTVNLEYGKERYDKYQRVLAYVFLDNININLKLVEKGFGNFYFPSGKDNYYNKFKDAWEECINNNLNLCENSVNKCSSCIELRELNVNNQRVILYNNCNFSCDLTNWEIKDEGRKKFVFEDFVLNSGDEVEIVIGEGINSDDRLYWSGEEYVWTETGDALFLRDEDGKLVLWESY